MPFATFATDNWIFIWLALSKLSIIPWVRARERCLTVQLGKAGLGQTHAPSTPAIPLQEQKRECTEAWPFQWDQQDTDNLFLFYKQMYLFYFSICFFLESLNSVVKVHNWQGETRTERQFSTQSPLKSQGDTAVSLTASHTNAAPLTSCYQAHTWWQLQPQHPTLHFRNWWRNLWDLCKKELRWQRQPADKKDAS